MIEAQAKEYKVEDKNGYRKRGEHHAHKCPELQHKVQARAHMHPALPHLREHFLFYFIGRHISLNFGARGAGALPRCRAVCEVYPKSPGN